MPRLEYFLVAESSAIDERTDRVSLFNILEQYRPPKLPFALPHCVAVCVWTREAEDAGKPFQALLKVTLPGEDETKDLAINFRMENEVVRNRLEISLIPLSRQGEIRFELSLNGKLQKTYVIHVLSPDSPA
jgi:hypothetical protein